MGMNDKNTDQAAPELLPCPFCGSTNIDPEFSLTHQADGKKTRAPGCTSCGATADDPDAWNRRADLSSPSAPAEVEGLVEQAGTEFSDYFRNNYPGPDTIIHDPDWHAPRLFAAATRKVATALTAQQAENERLREAMRGLAGALAEAEGRARKAEAERDEARATAAAAYERAAHLIECDGDAMGGKNGAAKAIRALATEAETNALDRIVKRAVDAETRDMRKALEDLLKAHESGWPDKRDWGAGDRARATIARLDQRKEAGE